MSVGDFHSVCLIVGNGLTWDFVSEVGPGVTRLHPSLPLWNFKSPSISYDWFIPRLPNVYDQLVRCRATFRDDFVAMKRFPLGVPPAERTRSDCELRRFLALAYSSYQVELDRYPYHRWRWTGWLRQYRQSLSTIVSFNYDVVVERALSAAGLRYYRTGSPEVGGIPIMKPHGSIDFEIPPHVLGFDSEEDIWNNYFELNDGGTVRVLPKAEWLRPRVQPDLVPPASLSRQLGLYWVRIGYEQFLSRTRNIDAVVVVGFSYQDVDRPEFDYLLQHISARVPVVVIDPNPSEDLILKLRSDGNEVILGGLTLPEL